MPCADPLAFLQKDKHLTFEDPRATTSDPAGSKFSTQEWLDSLEQAREVALSQSYMSTGSFSGGESSSLYVSNGGGDGGSPADSLGGGGGGDQLGTMPGPNVERHALRQTLRKTHTGDGGEGEFGARAGKKRFSKRHSKSGLAAVF